MRVVSSSVDAIVWDRRGAARHQGGERAEDAVSAERSARSGAVCFFWSGPRVVEGAVRVPMT